MHVLLDLYGVLLDPEKVARAYRERLVEILAGRFGGVPDQWGRAHDEAFVEYVNRAGDADWDARGWAEIVDELDARSLITMFERVGVAPPPENALAFSRRLERDVLASIDVRYPDARAAIDRIRAAGHHVHVATGGSETADAALRGAGLLDRIEVVFTGHTQNATKARAAYWTGIPRRLEADPGDCVLVDDRLDYLDAATSTGILALLLDRKGKHRPENMPAFVRATLRNLAALPHWLEMWTAARPQA